MGQLEEMSLFVRVVEAGSISKAATQLNMAKSAVSRRLVELEKRVGNQLLIRTTRNSSMTQQGELFYQRALSILEDVAQLNETTQHHAQAKLSGEMRISVPLEFGVMHLSDMIEEFARLHPQLKIQVDFSNQRQNLIEGGYEMALRIARLKDSSLHARNLCEIRHVLVASPGYLKQFGEPQQPEDLLRHRFLAYDLVSFNATAMTDKEGNVHQIQPQAVMKSNNGFFLKNMAINDMGMVCMPTFVLYDAIADGRLQPVLQNFTFPTVFLNAVYPNTRYTGTRVRAFIDYLVSKVGNTPFWDSKILSS